MNLIKRFMTWFVNKYWSDEFINRNDIRMY